MQKDNLYQKFMELKKEIEKHKWIESEKQGNDIGFEKALVENAQLFLIDLDFSETN